MNHEVTIYSTPTCHFCHMAKDYLNANKIIYTDFDVSVDHIKRGEMIGLTGQMGVPVIKIDDKIIVGFDRGRIASILGLE